MSNSSIRENSIRLGTLIILLVISIGLHAQGITKSVDSNRSKNEQRFLDSSHWRIKSASGFGWPTTLQLLDQSTSDVAAIGILGLQYRRPLAKQWSYALTTELMLIQRTGDLAGRAYRMRNLSFGLEGSLIYQLPNPKWHLSAGMQLRTHRPISAVDIKRSDNVRFEQRVMGSYQLSKHLDLTTTVGRSLRSRDDSAYFTDPQYQILTGVLWKF